MQQFIYQPGSQFLNGSGFAFGKRGSQLPRGTQQFLLPQCFNALAQVADRIDDAERA